MNCSQGTGARETNTDGRFYRDVGIKYHGMKALDIPTYNMIPHFKDASNFIEKALKKEGKDYGMNLKPYLIDTSNFIRTKKVNVIYNMMSHFKDASTFLRQ